MNRWFADPAVVRGLKGRPVELAEHPIDDPDRVIVANDVIEFGGKENELFSILCRHRPSHVIHPPARIVARCPLETNQIVWNKSTSRKPLRPTAHPCLFGFLAETKRQEITNAKQVANGNQNRRAGSMRKNWTIAGSVKS